MWLEVKDIWVHYGGVCALRGISLELERGALVTVIGANGAGKTTTLRAISGLQVPTSGEIWFEGKRIDGLPPFQIVALGIAHVPEGKQLFSDMTVLENLRMGAYLRKDKEVEKSLGKVYQYFPVLEERHRQQASRLSGGEQQMVAIGRALMSRPKLLLLDEPSMGLSPLMIREMAKMITQVKDQEGVSIILVEQNANLAFSLAQRAYVLETGIIAMTGDCNELSKNEQVKKVYLGR